MCLDISEIEGKVRGIKTDGLLWGACMLQLNVNTNLNIRIYTAKILPVAYGIKKLQICCVIEDDKVGTDFLEENIMAFEELVSKH